MALFSATGFALGIVNALSPSRGIQRYPNIAYGEHPRHKLDLYRRGDGRRLPTVLFIHGGYWSAGERAHYRFVGEALAQRGYLCGVMSYRLFPEVGFPHFIHDAAAALATLRNIAGRYGGDPEQLYVGGHSAGAHSALMLALDNSYLEGVGGSPQWLKGVFGLSGPYDFLPPKAAKVAAIFGPPEHYPRGNTVNFVGAEQPPALLIHGRDDSTVSARNSQRLAELLRAAGNEAQLFISDGGHIAPLLAFSGLQRRRSKVLNTLAQWLDGTSRLAQADPGELSPAPYSPQ